jgi:hypothetical protein
MKNLRFLSGMFLGLIFGVFLVFIVKCKSEPATSTLQNLELSTSIGDIENYSGVVYKLTIDNIQYIVVSNGSSGGISIVKHK